MGWDTLFIAALCPARLFRWLPVAAALLVALFCFWAWPALLWLPALVIAGFVLEALAKQPPPAPHAECPAAPFRRRAGGL